MSEEKITSFTKLKAWQKGHLLALEVYRVTDSFPVSQRYGLTAQIQRACTSITSNIAEGFNRRTKADKAHFYQVSVGSCSEVQNQLLLTKDLQFLSVEKFKQLADLSIEVHKLLNGLIKSLEVRK